VRDVLDSGRGPRPARRETPGTTTTAWCDTAGRHAGPGAFVAPMILDWPTCLDCIAAKNGITVALYLLSFILVFAPRWSFW
jgi:hypothetical protein